MKSRFAVVLLIVANLTSAMRGGELSRVYRVSSDQLPIRSCAFSRSGNELATRGGVLGRLNFVVHQIDRDKRALVAWPRGAPGTVAVAKGGTVVVLLEGAQYSYWKRDTNADNFDKPIAMDGAIRYRIAVSDNGRVIATIAKDGIRVIEVENNRVTRLHGLRNEDCRDVCLTDDGDFVAVVRTHADGELPGLSVVGVWKEEVKFEVTLPRDYENATLAMSADAEIIVVAPPDGDSSAFGTPQTVLVWNTISKKPLPSVTFEGAGGLRPVLSSDGRFLCLTKRYQSRSWLLRVYDLSDGDLLDELQCASIPGGELGSMFPVTFIGESTDVRFLHTDGTVYSWKPSRQ